MIQFEAGYDLADIGQFRVDVVETGGATFSVTISTGKYFFISNATSLTGDYAPKVTSYGSLLTAIFVALNAGTGSGSYLTGIDLDTQKVLISHSGGSVTAFSLTFVNNGGLIGFTTNRSGALSYNGNRAPDYYIQGSEGSWTENVGDYEGGDDVAWDTEAHDGSPSGVAKPDAPIYVDMVIPLEPVSKVGNFPALVSPADAWTWKKLFKHCRNVHPIAIDNAEFYRLRAEGAKFRPRPLIDNYRGHFDIPLLMRLLGRY